MGGGEPGRKPPPGGCAVSCCAAIFLQLLSCGYHPVLNAASCLKGFIVCLNVNIGTEGGETVPRGIELGWCNLTVELPIVVRQLYGLALHHEMPIVFGYTLISMACALYV